MVAHRTARHLDVAPGDLGSGALFLPTLVLVAAASAAAVPGLPRRRPRRRAVTDGGGVRGVSRRPGPPATWEPHARGARHRRPALKPVPENPHVAQHAKTFRTTLPSIM